jgi:hypothetical protein
MSPEIAPNAAERDRQVVVAAFLGQVGRRQIDGELLRRHRQARRVQRRLNPLAAFGHRLVCQADECMLTLPDAIITCTSTGTASMPWKATVRTRATIF